MEDEARDWLGRVGSEFDPVNSHLISGIKNNH